MHMLTRYAQHMHATQTQVHTTQTLPPTPHTEGIECMCAKHGGTGRALPTLLGWWGRSRVQDVCMAWSVLVATCGLRRQIC